MSMSDITVQRSREELTARHDTTSNKDFEFTAIHPSIHSLNHITLKFLSPLLRVGGGARFHFIQVS